MYTGVSMTTGAANVRSATFLLFLNWCRQFYFCNTFECTKYQPLISFKEARTNKSDLAAASEFNTDDDTVSCSSACFNLQYT
jgi:hypothetical protein